VWCTVWRSQDKLKQVMPGGTGLPGPLLFLISMAIAAIIAFYAFTFRVDPDELGVVMLFGKPVRTEPPGLHFRQPYPIEDRNRHALKRSGKGRAIGARGKSHAHRRREHR
jgi:membrane protease subunit HflK